jgi:hypothetical protein
MGVETMSRGLFAVVIAGLLWVAPSLAQVGSVELVGSVRDPSGASVIGAKVVLTSTETGYTRTGVSNEVGVFTLTSLGAGNYTLDVEASGFRRKKIDDIVLNVGQRTRLDVNLEIGSLTETIEVSVSAPLVESENAVVGGVIEGNTITQLPLNGRDFMQLALLTGGVNEGQAGGPNSTTPVGAGIPHTGNAYTLDGANNKEDFRNTVGSTPVLDSVREFKIQVGQTSAEYGYSGGVVINAVTKSGTNRFQGSLWEFHRNKSVDCFPFFRTVNSAGVPTKTPLIRNQYGGTLGGPIVRNRTFFFGAYEALRERRTPINQTLTKLPTAAERSGDLSEYARLVNRTIVDPFAAKAPFPGNVIPVNRIDAISTDIMAATFVEPTNPSDPLRNFGSLLKSRTDNHAYLVRLDHRFSDRHQLFGRYNLTDADVLNRGAVALGLQVGDTAVTDRRQNVTIGLTSPFSPIFLNDLNLGFIRYRSYSQYGPNALDFGGAAAVGFAGPILREGSPGGGFPTLNLRGATSFIDFINASPPTRITTETYTLSDSVTRVFQRHIVKTGAEIRKNRGAALLDRYANLGFTNRFSGDAFSDFLLGIPSNISGVRLDVPEYSDLHNWSFAGYVQDDWKASPKLTLNFGLRYEVGTPVVEDHGFAGSFDPTLGGGVGGLVYPKQNTTAQPFFTSIRPDLPYAISDRASAFDADANNWGPRFGFAWRPMGNTGTVVRGGYGVYYFFASITSLIRFLGDIPPHVLSANLTSSPSTPTLKMNSAAEELDRLTNSVKSGNINTNVSVGREALNTYNQQWSLSISRVLSRNTVLEFSYLGSKATHVRIFKDIQYALDGPSPAPLQPRLPHPKWGQVNGYYYGGSANYHGGVVTLERRFARGLGLKGAYTYSKSMQMGGGWGRAAGDAWIQNVNDLKNEVALGADSLTHRLTGFALWDLPFGPGKRLLSGRRGALRHLVGGWQMSGIFTVRSGFPFAMSVSNSRCNVAHSIACRPNVIDPKEVYTLGGNGVDRPKYRRESFPSPNFAYGNAGLNILFNNGYWNVDGSLTKRTRLDWVKERSTLEIRFEAFNLLNHPSFPTIISNPETPTFGRAQTAYEPRRLQGGVKFTF